MESALDPPLATRVARACRDLGLPAGARLLVAVSGGADSAALACLLAEARAEGLDVDLTLAHLDHGWRGAEAAAADRDVVEALAARLRLPLLLAGPPSGRVPRSEDGARRWRYRTLARLAREADCAFVATGHHAGDQAETFLMRLLRGSGLAGLAGIPARRPLGTHGCSVLRPLLDVEPRALRQVLRERGIDWREDPTNADVARDRAALRARLAPHQARTLAGLARRLRRRLERRLARIAAVAADAYEPHPWAGAVRMPRAALAALHGEDLALALRLAGERLCAERDGPWFVRRHVAVFERLLADGGDLDLPRGLRLHVAGASAWLAWRRWRRPPLPRLEHAEVTVDAFDLDAWRARGATREAALDAERLGPAPRLGWLEDEDRFTPLGHGAGGATRVKDWLARGGVPGLARRGQLVVRGRSGVAWVVGRRIDREHAVGPATRRVALLGVER